MPTVGQNDDQIKKEEAESIGGVVWIARLVAIGDLAIIVVNFHIPCISLKDD